MNFNRPLILGSKSPRRQQILKEAGFTFEVRGMDVEEIYPPNISPQEVPVYLAELKASAYLPQIKDEVLITCDTIVILDNEIIGKPENEEHAVEMLEKLSGQKHDVISGVCMMSHQKKVVFSDRTEVFFRTLKKQEIDFYLKHFKPYDKAGSYGIQEWIGMVGITGINGSYFNVMGLPIEKLYKHLIGL